MALSRILIVKLSSLGDVIHALPVAGALRRRFPRARITWLVGPASAGVVRMCRHVDGVIIWNPGRRPRLPMLAEVRATRPQVALELQGLIRTACLAWLSGARWRVGFRSCQEGGRLLCNLPAIRPRTDVHAVDGYLEFARYLGVDDRGRGAACCAPTFGLAVPEPARIYGAEMAASHGAGAPMVALLPGTRWPTKRWPPEHFAALAAGLGRLGVRCVVLGGREDMQAGATIASAAPVAVVDLTGRTSLAESAAIMLNCAAAVCNDSGPMHLAAALGVRVVALFGPTDPVRTGPYGTGHTVIQAPVACAGCRRRRCRRACMSMILPERVLEAVNERMASKG